MLHVVGFIPDIKEFLFKICKNFNVNSIAFAEKCKKNHASNNIGANDTDT